MENQGERERREGGNRGKKPQTPHYAEGESKARSAKKDRESGEDTEAEEETKNEEEGDRNGETPGGAPLEAIHKGGDMPPPEEDANLPGFTPERAHLFFQGVYGDFPHHNDGSHLDGGIADNAVWQHYWRRLAAMSASWYATPSGAVVRRFTAILTAEWWGILSRSWNSKRPLVFAHVILTKMLGVPRAREIRARIMRRIHLW